jgi:hypothetical protein
MTQKISYADALKKAVDPTIVAPKKMIVYAGVQSVITIGDTIYQYCFLRWPDEKKYGIQMTDEQKQLFVDSINNYEKGLEQAIVNMSGKDYDEAINNMDIIPELSKNMYDRVIKRMYERYCEVKSLMYENENNSEDNEPVIPRSIPQFYLNISLRFKHLRDTKPSA